MAHQQHRVRPCELMGRVRVSNGGHNDGNLGSVVPLAGGDFLHRCVPDCPGVLLCLYSGPCAAKLGNDVDPLIPLPADVANRPAGTAQDLGAVPLVLDRAHRGEVQPVNALAIRAEAVRRKQTERDRDAGRLERMRGREVEQRDDAEGDDPQRTR